MRPGENLHNTEEYDMFTPNSGFTALLLRTISWGPILQLRMQIIPSPDMPLMPRHKYRVVSGNSDPFVQLAVQVPGAGQVDIFQDVEAERFKAWYEHEGTKYEISGAFFVDGRGGIQIRKCSLTQKTGIRLELIPMSDDPPEPVIPAVCRKPYRDGAPREEAKPRSRKLKGGSDDDVPRSRRVTSAHLWTPSGSHLSLVAAQIFHPDLDFRDAE